MPKSQITSATLEGSIIRVSGPFDAGPTEVGLILDVVLIQEGAYAHGHTSPKDSLAADWVVEADTVGEFDPDKPVQSFGSVLLIDLAEPGNAVHQDFAWSQVLTLPYPRKA